MTGTARLLLSLLGILSCSHAMAESSISHSGVLQTEYSRAHQSGVQRTDTGIVLATLFLEEVNHGDLPHSQAAYLERASNLTLAWTELNADFGASGSARGDSALVDIQYIMPSHWIIGGGYSRFRLSGLSEQRTHNLEFGRYLDDTSSIMLTFARTKDEDPLLSDSITRKYGIEYKNVTLHPTADTSLTINLTYNHIDASAGTSNLVGAQGEYHFTLASSVLAGVEVATGEEKGVTLSVGVSHYITHHFAIGAGYSRDQPKQQQHTDTVSAYARLLF